MPGRAGSKGLISFQALTLEALALRRTTLACTAPHSTNGFALDKVLTVIWSQVTEFLTWLISRQVPIERIAGR